MTPELRQLIARWGRLRNEAAELYNKLFEANKVARENRARINYQYEQQAVVFGRAYLERYDQAAAIWNDHLKGAVPHWLALQIADEDTTP